MSPTAATPPAVPAVPSAASASLEGAAVHVVDDDGAARDSLRFLLESVGLRVFTYASAAELRAARRAPVPSCLLVDVRMPGTSGVELLEQLRAAGDHTPAIVLTAYGDVPTTVRAFKGGALDLVEKPYSGTELVDRVQKALRADAERLAVESRRADLLRRFALLTDREREVLELVVAGSANKVVAADLGISIKTVEIHRARVMDKMGADSLAHLVTMYIEATGQAPAGRPPGGEGENP